MVEMLRVDIRDHDDVGRELDEGAVRLVRLHHHPVARAHARIGAVGVDDAAVDDGRIEPAGVEERGDERRRRGLAVRAADRDRRFRPHQLGQHLRAPDDGSPRARAATSSGLSRLIAEETTTTAASARFSAHGRSPLRCRGRAGAARWRCRPHRSRARGSSGWRAPRRCRSSRYRRSRRNEWGRCRAAISYGKAPDLGGRHFRRLL